MKIKKIEIDIKNNKRYTDVALLVDKKDFVIWIAELRAKWKIDKLFNPKNYRRFYTHIWGTDDSDKRWQEFYTDILKVREAFELTPNFDKVIEYAIGFTLIPDYAYKSCYLRTFDSPKLGEEYAIVVTPNTTKSEVDNELKNFKQKMRQALENVEDKSKMDKVIAKYNFTYEFGPKRKDFDQITTIKRLREWYWALYGDILNGKTTKPGKYEDGYDFCPKKGKHNTEKERLSCPFCSIDDINTIQQALPSYLERLQNS